MSGSHRPLIGVALSDALQVGEDGGIRREIEGQEVAHGRQGKDDHDVRRREVASGEIVDLGEAGLDQTEREVEPTLHGPQKRIVRGQVQADQDHVPAGGRLQRAVGEMEPVKELGEVGMVGGQHEAAVAVPGCDVLDDGGRFGQHHVAVGDHRRGAEGMQRLVFRRREHGDGKALVALQVVRDAEFLAQPDDPLGLRFTQVMDGQHAETLLLRSRQSGLGASAGHRLKR
jgi:hypothetical protein